VTEWPIRTEIDRATLRRGDEAWVRAAWADPRAQVLVVDDGQAQVRFRGEQAELVFVPAAKAPEGTSFLLGTDGDGITYFGVAAPLSDGVAGFAGPAAEGGAAAGVRTAGLRQAGSLLSARDAGLMAHAVALANWHATHTHCPRCGTATVPAAAGHFRRCPRDGSEHFPRTDPAMIVLVTDTDDRCLLGRNAAWPHRRFSVLAGFVEPGESAEQAVAREVLEETGILVSSVEYVASQPWPMPHSLMLGFRARADGGQTISIDSVEIAEARWFTREQLRDSLDRGDVLLPPPASIAHRLIRSWYGADLDAG
jgi:NAD+ diphosphatase